MPFRAKMVGMAAGSLVALAACSDGTGPSAGQARVALSVGTTLGASAAPGAAPEVLTVGGSTLVFQKVELVLKQIELHRAQASTNCDDEASNAPSMGESNSGGDKSGEGSGKHRGGADKKRDDCEEFQTGPLLLDLPLGSGLQHLVTVDVDTGTYNAVEFTVRSPSNDAAGQAFLQANPDFQQITVRVTGTFNGKAFTYSNDVKAKQEAGLNPNLVVTAKGATDLTLVVDVKHWFETDATGLIDPTTAMLGGPNDAKVRANIRNSFRLFEDKDHNGHDDHNGNDH